MPKLTVTKNWDDGQVLTEAMLDAIKSDLETFFNTTKIDSDNIADNGVTTAKINDLAVTTAKIAASNVTNAKIADGAVTGYKSKVTVASKAFADSPYTATTADDLILCNTTGGAITVNLPAAASSTGKVLKIKKTSSDFTAVTIDGNASETIDGAATTTINTQYEQVTIACDGSNWQIIDRRIPTALTITTPTISWTASSPVKTAYAWRVGNRLWLDFRVVLGGAPNSATFSLTLPDSLEMDTALMVGSTENVSLGEANLLDSGSNRQAARVRYASSTTVNVAAVGVSGSLTTLTNVTELVPFSWTTSDELHMRFSVPISGWKG